MKTTPDDDLIERVAEGQAILEAPTYRSAEELEMRAAIEAWGRPRYPGARLVHELVVGNCRIDMAFIQREHIAGFEIKSSKDKLDRLDRQVAEFTQCIPELWLAFAPRWADAIRDARVPHRVGRVIVAGGVEEKIPSEFGGYAWPHSATKDRMMTAPMLHLLWRDELYAIASRHRLPVHRRDTVAALGAMISRSLTGDEIVRGVCRELRARQSRWKADAPMYEPRPALNPAPAQPDGDA